jgi:hypothetical protein
LALVAARLIGVIGIPCEQVTFASKVMAFRLVLPTFYYFPDKSLLNS